MATDYGTDFDCVTDVTPSLAEISGPLTVAQSLARMLQTRPYGPGSLPYAPGRGIDVRDFQNASVTPSVIEAQIESQALMDDRILSVDVTAELVDGDLIITIDGEGDDGPFELVMNVADLTVKILLGAGA